MSDLSEKETNLPVTNSDQEIIRLLKRQNKLLHDLSDEILSGMKEDGRQNLYRVTLKDLDISIGDLVIFTFKWLVAYIPVGIVFGIVYVIILAIVVGIK